MHASLRGLSLALALALPAVAAPTVRSGPSLELARTRHAAVRLFDGRVLIAGGTRTSDRSGPGAEVFDPRTQRFTPVENSEDRFHGPTVAARLDDGRVLIAAYQGGVWSFDPSTDRVSKLDLDLGRWSCRSLHRLRDGRVALLTGALELHVYDPRSGRAALVADGVRHASRGGFSATPLRGGEVLLLAGGSTVGGYNPQTVDEAHQLRADGERETGDLQVKRHLHSALALGTRKALIVGGRRTRFLRSAVPVGSLELYDLDRGAFTKVDSLRYPRWGAAVVRDGADALIVGGATRSAELYTVEVYSIRSERVLDAERFRLRAKRAFSSATRLFDGRVLVVGGEVDGAALRSSELIRR